MRPQTLSVVMPNFNHGRFIDQSLRAILEQSFRALEVVVVDDGSGDDSVEIVSRLCRQHPALRLLRNSRNRGVCYSIKRGLQACSGEYVYCTSADDLVLPGFFEKSMRLLARHPQAGLCFAHCSTLDGVTGEVEENRFDWGDSPRYFSPQALAKILDGDIIPGHAAILRRAALVGAGGVIPELQWHWDWFANLVVAFREGACFIPATVALLRNSTESFGESGRRSAQQRQVIDRLLYLLASPAYADVRSYFEESGALKHFAPEVLRVAIRNHDHWEPNRIRLDCAGALPGVRAALARRGPGNPRRSVSVCRGAGTAHGDVVPVLLGALEDKDDFVRLCSRRCPGENQP